MQRAMIALVVVGVLVLIALYAGRGRLTGQGAGREPQTTATLEGRLSVAWDDAAPDSTEPSKQQLQLITDDGQVVELDASTLVHGDVSGLAGERVVVKTESVAGGGMIYGEVPTARALSIKLSVTAEGPGAARAMTGTQDWINILCKFADVADEPMGPDYLEAVFSDSYPGMGDFWDAQSYGEFDVSAQTFGWYRLPQPKSAYYSGSSLDRDMLLQDCVATAEPDLPPGSAVDGINVVYNDDNGEAARAAVNIYNLLGEDRYWKLTFLPPWAAAHHGVVAHEMGHTLGLGHSDKPGGDSFYDNVWDLMSAPLSFAGFDPAVGRIGKHLNAYHKDRLGWLGDSEVLVIDQNLNGRDFLLERLDEPAAPGYLAAILPISDTRFFTIEARMRLGYDVALPGNAVIIHDVDTSRYSNKSQLVSAWAGGSVGDAGEMWQPGEVYANAELGVLIEVQSEDASGFSISARYPECGDGVREPGIEGCDDGNTNSGDDCSATCQPEGGRGANDERCLDALVKSGSKVSQTQMREASRCMKDYAKGNSSRMGDCVTSDVRGKVEKAAARTITADSKNCGAEPAFGYVGAEAVNDAAIVNAVAAQGDLFGMPLEDRLMRSRAQPEGAKCQKTAAKQLGKLMKLQLVEYRSCVKAQAGNGAVTSEGALAQCLTAATYDKNGKIRNATLKTRHKIRNACWQTDLDAFSEDCDPSQTISQCTERVASCSVCRTAAGMNGFGEDCDLFDDGEPNSTCTP